MTIVALATFLFICVSSAAVQAGAGKRSPKPPLLKGEKPWAATYRNPVNRNLIRLARCETGYLSGRRINWRHHNSTYSGGLGFAHSTWTQFRVEVRPLPPRVAAHATALQQLAVGRALVRRFGGYSSWPACHRRLGIY
jgi:hypothetical protein